MDGARTVSYIYPIPGTHAACRSKFVSASFSFTIIIISSFDFDGIGTYALMFTSHSHTATAMLIARAVSKTVTELFSSGFVLVKTVPKSQKPPILNIFIKRALTFSLSRLLSYLFFFSLFFFLFFLHQSTTGREVANGKISKPQHQKIYCAKHRQQQNVTRIDLAFLFIEIHRHHLLSFHCCATIGSATTANFR